MQDFTAVLPVRNTDLEYGFLRDSLASCIELEPSEVILCLDGPSERIMNKARQVADFFSYSGLKFLTVPRTPDWNFQLAKIVWNAYNKAENDIVLSFDVDTVLLRRVLRGLQIVGHNNVALVSFRKIRRVETIPELVAQFTYLTLPVGRPFAGLYFLDRKAYFDTISEDAIKAIHNGIDTLISQEILRQKRYRLVCLRDWGCISMRHENEDYSWRQLLAGFWLAAHSELFTGPKSPRSMNPLSFHFPGTFVVSVLRKFKSFQPSLQAMLWGHPYLLKGYLLGSGNLNHPAIARASEFENYNDYTYIGKQALAGIK